HPGGTGSARSMAPAAPTDAAAGDEAAAKDALRYAGGQAGEGANSLGLFGFTLVSCERGDLRESPDGLLLYQGNQVQRITLPDELRGEAELEELYQAVRHGQPIVHDGHWGEATLEVCIAIHESARTRREVLLERQTAVSA